jgi:hypothetical protein
MLTVHDWISGRAQRIRLLERLLDRILADPTVWTTTVGDVAAHHEASVNKDRFVVNARLPEAIGPRRFGQKP